VFLGLREDQCYAEVEKALSEVKADFCTIVVPPAVHEMVVDSALAHDLHILSEKPIADTLAGSIRIAEPDRSRSPGTSRSCQCQCQCK
jgi:predicted dehydrogenase